jgi:hypothetical protein
MAINSASLAASSRFKEAHTLLMQQFDLCSSSVVVPQLYSGPNTACSVVAFPAPQNGQVSGGVFMVFQR